MLPVSSRIESDSLLGFPGSIRIAADTLNVETLAAKPAAEMLLVPDLPVRFLMERLTEDQLHRTEKERVNRRMDS